MPQMAGFQDTAGESALTAYPCRSGWNGGRVAGWKSRDSPDLTSPPTTAAMLFPLPSAFGLV